jgi:hypothetical protein
MTFLFKLDDTLKRIIEHTTKHKDTCKLAYSGGKETDPDTVYLVKDQGVYIMACTEPPLTVEQGKPQNIVAYAETHGADTWLGGDDFAENIPAAWFRDAFAEGNKGSIILTLTDKEITAKAIPTT